MSGDRYLSLLRSKQGLLSLSVSELRKIRNEQHGRRGRQRRKAGGADGQSLRKASDGHREHCKRPGSAGVAVVHCRAPRRLRLRAAGEGVLVSHCTQLHNGMQVSQFLVARTPEHPLQLEPFRLSFIDPRTSISLILFSLF